MTLIGVRLGVLLGGVIVVETLFAYPGLGPLAYQAALARDAPVSQAMVLLGGLAILACNAAGDSGGLRGRTPFAAQRPAPSGRRSRSRASLRPSATRSRSRRASPSLDGGSRAQ